MPLMTCRGCARRECAEMWAGEEWLLFNGLKEIVYQNSQEQSLASQLVIHTSSFAIRPADDEPVDDAKSALRPEAAAARPKVIRIRCAPPTSGQGDAGAQLHRLAAGKEDKEPHC